MLKLQNFIEHSRFNAFIIILILINAVTLGLETDDDLMANYAAELHFVDTTILGIFVAEILARLFVYRASFFRGGWNWFDLIIVGLSLLPASGSFAILRSLRVFRVLRLLSVVPSLRRVISALLKAIPGMASIMSVLLVIYFVSAVLATHVFGHTQDETLEALFGTIGRSMFTLFQLMTLEGWRDGIAEPTMAIYPWSWIFFVVFIIITSFAVLNLFIGVIVDAMNIVHEEEEREKSGGITLQEDVRALRQEIKDLRAQLDKKQN